MFLQQLHIVSKSCVQKIPQCVQRVCKQEFFTKTAIQASDKACVQCVQCVHQDTFPSYIYTGKKRYLMHTMHTMHTSIYIISIYMILLYILFYDRI